MAMDIVKLHQLEGQWQVVSPIHWQATHNDAMIIACGDMLQLSEAQSRQWFDVFAQFLNDGQTTLYYHDAYTWLIQKKAAPPLHAKPASLLLQQSLTPHLKALDSTGFWQRLITEVQMLFSQHALNAQQLEGFPINGIWIWGVAPQKRSKCQKIISRLSSFAKIFGGKSEH